MTVLQGFFVILFFFLSRGTRRNLKPHTNGQVDVSAETLTRDSLPQGAVQALETTNRRKKERGKDSSATQDSSADTHELQTAQRSYDERILCD